MSRGREYMQGTRNRNAKLTDALVAAMRAEYAKGDVAQHDLARRYGLSKRTVHLVVTAKTWRHVPVSPNNGGET